MTHQGPNGDRGQKGTLMYLEPHFLWNNMENDVEKRRMQCLQCIKVADGTKVPRPLGTQLLAERPTEVLMMDYIKIWPSETGRTYVLMQVCKFTKLCEFIPTFETTAIPACQALLSWGSRYGLPEWLIRDGGTHFANRAMELLTDKLGVQHRITLAHCTWSNGAIEVVGKALLRVLRVLLSEFNLALEKWEPMMPLVQYTVNNML